jgi:uncharacterized repeat protein (TIGR02543 family)
MKNHTQLALACIFLLIILIGGCDLATPAFFEIRYHSNDGSDTVIVQSAPPEAAVVLQANSFTREGYSFAGWMATEPDGTALDFSDGQEILMGSAPIDLYANWESEDDGGLLQSSYYSFPGSAGRLVFYDKRYYSDGWRFLEMAPAATEWTAEWGAHGYLANGENRISREFPPWAQENSIYGGALNTQQIVQYHNNLGIIYPGRGDYYTNPGQYSTGETINNIEVVGDGSVAAKTCLDFVYNDCDDWYLPSMNELSLFAKYFSSSSPDCLKPEKYWSSNQINEGVAGSYNRADLYNQKSLKFEKLRVRAMRAF